MKKINMSLGRIGLNRLFLRPRWQIESGKQNINFQRCKKKKMQTYTKATFEFVQ